MKKTLLSIFLALSLFNNMAMAATQTIKANVNGMVCAFCAQGIEKKVRALPQTQDVYVNLKQRVVLVELKDGQTLSFDSVKDLIKDAGYDVTSIETVSHPIAHLKADFETDAKGATK